MVVSIFFSITPISTQYIPYYTIVVSNSTGRLGTFKASRVAEGSLAGGAGEQRAFVSLPQVDPPLSSSCNSERTIRIIFGSYYSPIIPLLQGEGGPPKPYH